jgi:sugar/nucleoside kinase (ribokinase family)
MDPAEHIDYLVVGHICYDLTPDGRQIGGTAAYSAAAASVLGCRTAVVTSSAAGDEWGAILPGAAIQRVPAAQTTTFENDYSAGARRQTIHAVAARLGVDDVPQAWQRAKIMHVAPVADEVDPQIMRLAGSSLLGLTPQGWMRAWGEDGRVRARPWDAAAEYLPLATAVFISDEDLLEPEMLGEYRRHSNVLVLTQGAAGCVVYVEDEARSVPAPRVHAADTTGAGDIFATAFLVRLEQTAGNAWEAARFANEIAAQSVTVAGLAQKMTVLSTYLAGA